MILFLHLIILVQLPLYGMNECIDEQNTYTLSCLPNDVCELVTTRLDALTKNKLRLVDKHWYRIASKDNKNLFSTNYCHLLPTSEKEQIYHLYYFADKKNGLPVIESLLKKRINPHAESILTVSPFDIAIHNKNYKTAHALKAAFTENNALEKTSPHKQKTISRLAVALHNGDIDEIEENIKLGILLSTTRSYFKNRVPAISAATFLNHEHIVQYIIAKHPKSIKSSTNGHANALHYASYTGNTNIMKLLLPYFKDTINQRCADTLIEMPYETSNLWSALHIASYHGNLNAIALLLAYRAKIDETNNYGTTPLMMAAYNGQYHAVKALIENGANIHCHNVNKKNALHYASLCKNTQLKANYIKIIELLIERKININKQESNGNTALHNALSKNNTDIALLLTQHGAQQDLVNNQKKTPLDIALEKNNNKQ